jgi:type IV pilus assembly protein PilF
MQNNKKLTNTCLVKNSCFVRTSSLIVGVLFCFILSACVTETVSGKKRIIDKDKSLDLHVEMALGYIDKGNRDSARHHLRKAFEIDSTSAPATGAMAKLFELEGESKLAEDQYKLALKRDPKFTQARNNYGIFLFGLKRYEEAFEEFEKAAADLEYPNRAQALTNVGRVAVKLGNTARAQAAFTHATVLDRNNPEAYIELADIYLQKQEYAEAKKYLDRYVTIGQQSSRSLMLGIRLERVFGNKDKEATLALHLKNFFPYSKEYLEYKQNRLN